MSALAESTIRVWSPPTSRRRFRTKHAAFVGWAKDLIRKRGEGCACDNGCANFRESAAPYTCPWHRRLFNADMFACEACGTPGEKIGERCGECSETGAGARCTVPVSVPGSSTHYMKLRNRLARWLRWASEHRP